MIAFNTNARDKTFYCGQIFRETFEHFVFCSSRKRERENYFFLNSVTVITVIPVDVYRLILNTSYRSKRKYIRKITKRRFGGNRKVFFNWKVIVCKMLMSSHISALRPWFMAVPTYLFIMYAVVYCNFFFFFWYEVLVTPTQLRKCRIWIVRCGKQHQ